MTDRGQEPEDASSDADCPDPLDPAAPDGSEDAGLTPELDGLDEVDGDLDDEVEDGLTTDDEDDDLVEAEIVETVGPGRTALGSRCRDGGLGRHGQDDRALPPQRGTDQARDRRSRQQMVGRADRRRVHRDLRLGTAFRAGWVPQRRVPGGVAHSVPVSPAVDIAFATSKPLSRREPDRFGDNVSESDAKADGDSDGDATSRRPSPRLPTPPTPQPTASPSPTPAPTPSPTPLPTPSPSPSVPPSPSPSAEPEPTTGDRRPRPVGRLAGAVVGREPDAMR